MQGVPGANRVAGSESCLFLNVWAPPADRCPEASCPVMFWIHGGLFLFGSGSEAVHHGSGLVAHAGDVVVVNVNYRLGVFGFLGSEALRGRDTEGGSTGNYGIQDQRAGLSWVQRNIHRFGGDAKNVMIFGWSAGGVSVGLHLTMRRSWPLYHKAAMGSGALAYWAMQTMQEAEQLYEDVLDAMGCSGHGLACLAAVNATELSHTTSFAMPLHARLYGGPFVAPTMDGVELEELPWDLLDAGRFNTRVPVLVGYTRDEGTHNVANPGLQHSRIYKKGFSMTAGDFVRLLTSVQFTVDPAQLPEILDVYSVNSTEGGTNYRDWYWVATHFTGDFLFSCPARRMARALSRFGRADVYLYFFAHRPRVSLPRAEEDMDGVMHGADLTFLFLAQPALVGEDEVALGRTMAGYWISFARSSDPNLPGQQRHPVHTDLTTRWEPFTADREASLCLDLPALSVGLGRHDRQCDLVDKLGVVPPSLELLVRPAAPGLTPAPQGTGCTEAPQRRLYV